MFESISESSIIVGVNNNSPTTHDDLFTSSLSMEVNLSHGGGGGKGAFELNPLSMAISESNPANKRNVNLLWGDVRSPMLLTSWKCLKCN